MGILCVLFLNAFKYQLAISVNSLILTCLYMADSWEILKLLADSTRVRILSLLTKEELSVAELQEVLNIHYKTCLSIIT